jgi:hypothetical protein
MLSLKPSKLSTAPPWKASAPYFYAVRRWSYVFFTLYFGMLWSTAERNKSHQLESVSSTFPETKHWSHGAYMSSFLIPVRLARFLRIKNGTLRFWFPFNFQADVKTGLWSVLRMSSNPCTLLTLSGMLVRIRSSIYYQLYWESWPVATDSVLTVLVKWLWMRSLVVSWPGRPNNIV